MILQNNPGHSVWGRAEGRGKEDTINNLNGMLWKQDCPQGSQYPHKQPLQRNPHAHWVSKSEMHAVSRAAPLSPSWQKILQETHRSCYCKLPLKQWGTSKQKLCHPSSVRFCLVQPSEQRSPCGVKSQNLTGSSCRISAPTFRTALLVLP